MAIVSEQAVIVITYSQKKDSENPRTKSKHPIAKPGKRDEGNYTCILSNAEKATAIVFYREVSPLGKV